MKTPYVKPSAQTILLSTNRIMDDVVSDPFALDFFDDNNQIPDISEF